MALLGNDRGLRQSRGQPFERYPAISCLRAALRRGDDDAAGQMAQPHARCYTIAMLAAGTARREKFQLALLLKSREII